MNGTHHGFRRPAPTDTLGRIVIDPVCVAIAVCAIFVICVACGVSS